ncbi:DUF1214 domain-containing protein [Streptomyces flavochromogenes]|uniref:DUF1214 domain-containing protein n=1 Tax=Streptomyces flavochromogenes TaxID=68199 RepID=UPI001FD74ECF|nr:DUF1214 domain-containing protein [Streptomyces flavochromogenes]
MHFDAGNTPPVDGFWSLTMMNERQFFVDNPLNRYAIGDRSDMRTNPDGSLDIYVQHADPGPDRQANRLPAPEGGFNVFLRLYWPHQSALTRRLDPAGTATHQLRPRSRSAQQGIRRARVP